MPPLQHLGRLAEKKWKILNCQRVLVKGGSGMAQQEPFNEVSLLCRKLGIPHVEYSLLFEGTSPIPFARI